MVEGQSRRLKVLAELPKYTEPVGATEVGAAIGETPRDTGKALYDLGKAGLAQKPDEKQSLWLITEAGRKYLEHPPVPSAGPPVGPLPGPMARPSARPSAGERAAGQPEETAETVPSQADLFRGIGERLGVGVRKGDVRLDAIMYFVERTADLDNLSSVWNALTKMGVANDVKKRWIEVYAQNLPGKEIPEELKEKLETGLESERVAEAKGEIAPKPKRFSVIENQIIGDPEGDYSFKEALQLVATQRGVPEEQASPLAAMVEAMKLGPEMATTTLTAMIPLITPGAKGGTPEWMSNPVAFIETVRSISGGEEKVSGPTWMSDPVAFIKAVREISGEPKTDDRVTAELAEVKKTLDEMREQRHREEIAAVVAQVKSLQDAHEKQMQDVLERLEEARKPITGRTEMDIIHELASGVLDEAKGVRTDIRGAVSDMFAGGQLPSPKTVEQRQERKARYRGALEKDERIDQLTRELFLGKG